MVGFFSEFNRFYLRHRNLCQQQQASQKEERFFHNLFLIIDLQR